MAYFGPCIFDSISDPSIPIDWPRIYLAASAQAVECQICSTWHHEIHMLTILPSTCYLGQPHSRRCMGHMAPQQARMVLKKWRGPLEHASFYLMVVHIPSAGAILPRHQLHLRPIFALHAGGKRVLAPGGQHGASSCAVEGAIPARNGQGIVLLYKLVKLSVLSSASFFCRSFPAPTLFGLNSSFER